LFHLKTLTLYATSSIFLVPKHYGEMEHDLQNYRAQLLLTPSYCASPLFLSGIGWQVDGSGHVLVEKTSNANTVVIVVGRVLDHRFFVTPDGNYSTDEFSNFSTTKFLFVLGNPDDTPFADDFNKILECFGKIQNQITSTPKHLNFITPVTVLSEGP
jgi:hypothetical protein